MKGSEVSSEIWFQSTRPVRDATLTRKAVDSKIYVSIHASRAGRDKMRW